MRKCLCSHPMFVSFSRMINIVFRLIFLLYPVKELERYTSVFFFLSPGFPVFLLYDVFSSQMAFEIRRNIYTFINRLKKMRSDLFLIFVFAWMYRECHYFCLWPCLHFHAFLSLTERGVNLDRDYHHNNAHAEAPKTDVLSGFKCTLFSLMLWVKRQQSWPHNQIHHTLIIEHTHVCIKKFLKSLKLLITELYRCQSWS